MSSVQLSVRKRYGDVVVVVADVDVIVDDVIVFEC